jgi:cytoskeletal protein RodZ
MSVRPKYRTNPGRRQGKDTLFAAGVAGLAFGCVSTIAIMLLLSLAFPEKQAMPVATTPISGSPPSARFKPRRNYPSYFSAERPSRTRSHAETESEASPTPQPEPDTGYSDATESSEATSDGLNQPETPTTTDEVPPVAPTYRIPDSEVGPEPAPQHDQAEPHTAPERSHIHEAPATDEP